MSNVQYFEDLSNKISILLRYPPAADLEKNIRALLQGAFTKLELVSREEFDIQAEALRQTRMKLAVLETRLAMLEAGIDKNSPV